MTTQINTVAAESPPTVKPGPWRITFDTNPDDCNLRCIMCEDHSPYSMTQAERLSAGRPKRRMDVGLIRRVLADSVGTPLREIIPSTMGEPLLYRDFDEILELCTQYGVKLNLTTNGTFPRRGAREWARRIVPVAADVKVSWNGSTKDTQESVMLGSNWEKVLENVRTFIAVRDEHAAGGGNRCRVTLQLTFMEVNYLELPEVVKLAAGLGVDRVKGHHLWAHFSQMRNQSMRRSPEAIARWNATVDAACEAAENHRLPNGGKVLLDNIFKLDPADEGRDSRRVRMPVPGTGGVGGLRRPVQPLLRSRCPAARAGRLRQPERHRPLRNLAESSLLGTPVKLHGQAPVPRLQYAEAKRTMSADWREYRISADGTHHVCDGNPAYQARFVEVLKFHSPGLAPVLDSSGAYHVTPDGRPAYADRHLRTFGFYEGRAAVHSADGWFHVLADGSPLYPERYDWCGNFQEGRCPVRLVDGRYFHIKEDGAPAYTEHHHYAGDFKDGYAVAQRGDGRHSHIGPSGVLLHGRWFLDLDVYHKNFARARDAQGWHHVDRQGEPLYAARFRNVEPFYNGQARVEGFDGSLSVIGESGETLAELRGPLRSPLEELSGDMVGMWRTQTIRASVEVDVFEALPASAEDIEKSLNLADSVGVRLMRALTELGLVRRDGQGAYHPTEKGALLQRSHPLSLADAASLWGGETYVAWEEAAYSLRTGCSAFRKLYGRNLFDLLRDRPEQLAASHRAFAAYARHDYRDLAESWDFGQHDHILDAGGGTGELAFALLRAFPNLAATVMDLPEVVSGAQTPGGLRERCRFVPGDFFVEWPAGSDAVVLARVLHDWPDDGATRILKRAREAMPGDGALYLVEMVLDGETDAGGLLDLNMLVVAGSAERTEEQFRRLLDGAGFELLEVIPTRSVSSIIRARAV